MKIVWIKKRRCASDQNDKEMFHLLYSLTVNELGEVVVPFTFMICFVSAYYGPNGELIGGVRSNHFHYTPVENINTFIEKLVLFMMVDFMSVLLASILLWTTCKINLFRSYILMQKEFWVFIIIITASCISRVWSIIIFYVFKVYFKRNNNCNIQSTKIK